MLGESWPLTCPKFERKAEDADRVIAELEKEVLGRTWRRKKVSELVVLG